MAAEGSVGETRKELYNTLGINFEVLNANNIIS